MSVILALNILRQEDHKFEDRLEYRIRPCLKKERNKNKARKQTKQKSWACMEW